MLRAASASFQAHVRGTKSPQMGTPAMDKKLVAAVEVRKDYLKLKERTTNLSENKGPLWKTLCISGNVIENK
jgi:hypothetical protein